MAGACRLAYGGRVPLGRQRQGSNSRRTASPGNPAVSDEPTPRWSYSTTRHPSRSAQPSATRTRPRRHRARMTRQGPGDMAQAVRNGARTTADIDHRQAELLRPRTGLRPWKRHNASAATAACQNQQSTHSRRAPSANASAAGGACSVCPQPPHGRQQHDRPQSQRTRYISPVQPGGRRTIR